jgi:hypothetical protein
MIRYGFDAVLKSRQQMDARDPIHRPILGRAVLTGMAAGLRVVNAVAPLKRRMAAGMLDYRDSDATQPA